MRIVVLATGYYDRYDGKKVQLLHKGNTGELVGVQSNGDYKAIVGGVRVIIEKENGRLDNGD